MSAIVVLVTVSSVEQGETIAHRLLDERLAACVNVVGPIRSLYRWQGKICDDDEWLLVIKSRRPLFARLSRTVRAVHSYDNPEVIALPVEQGADAYLRWLRTETTPLRAPRVRSKAPGRS